MSVVLAPPCKDQLVIAARANLLICGAIILLWLLKVYFENIFALSITYQLLLWGMVILYGWLGLVLSSEKEGVWGTVLVAPVVTFSAVPEAVSLLQGVTGSDWIAEPVPIVSAPGFIVGAISLGIFGVLGKRAHDEAAVLASSSLRKNKESR